MYYSYDIFQNQQQMLSLNGLIFTYFIYWQYKLFKCEIMISNAVLKYMHKNLSLRNITLWYMYLLKLKFYRFISLADFDSNHSDFESSYNVVRNASMSIAAIIGIVAGLIILVIVISIVVVCCCCMRSKWSMDFEFD